MPMDARSGTASKSPRALHFRRPQRDSISLVLLAEASALDQVRRHFLTRAQLQEWIRSKTLRARL
jgi:hypothetical protein